MTIRRPSPRGDVPRVADKDRGASYLLPSDYLVSGAEDPGDGNGILASPMNSPPGSHHGAGPH